MEFVLIVDHFFGFSVVPDVLHAAHIAVNVEHKQIIVVGLQDWHVLLLSLFDRGEDN